MDNELAIVLYEEGRAVGEIAKATDSTPSEVTDLLAKTDDIQRQGRQDVTVVARKGGYKKLAAVYTQVLRHCLDMTDADYEIADCFLDGIIGGKGC